MDGADDAGVAGAAAVGVLERDADVVVGRVRVFGQQGGGGHQQAGRAEAALHRAVGDERLLQRVEPFRPVRVVAGQPFHGDDRAALGLEGRVVTGEHRHAIHLDGADAALRFVAADLGAGQAEIVAQDFGQGARFGHVQGAGTSVDGEGEVGHGAGSRGMAGRCLYYTR